MQCSRIRDEVLATEKMDVLYGEADAEVRERVSVHLAECPACREEMADLLAVRRRLRTWTLDERRVPSVVTPPRALPTWLLTAAVVLLALGLALALRGQATLRHQLEAQRAESLERERVHRQELLALRAAESPGSLPDERALLARLDERIRRSEERQDRRLEAGLAEWTARTEARRRVDMARVAAGLSYLDGRHGQQLARTNELMGYVLETAAEKGGPR